MTVIKLGGSLLDLPDLGVRLRGLLNRLSTRRVLLIPGGGEAAENVRRLQAVHGFSDELAHAFAVEAMDFNGRLLCYLLPEFAGTDSLEQAKNLAAAGTCALPKITATLPDCMARLEREFPKDWSFTSDSIAAAHALALRAERLVLLKSRPETPGLTWEQHAADGLVDRSFPYLAALLPRIEVVDLRSLGALLP